MKPKYVADGDEGSPCLTVRIAIETSREMREAEVSEWTQLADDMHRAAQLGERIDNGL